MDKILCIIPARMGSSRFPGKPLYEINGVPMIGQVYKRVSKNNLLERVVVATCDEEIFDYIESIGGEAIMTSNCHERASDRCAEALLKLEKKHKKIFDIVVMVQGDEPMTHPDMITEATLPLINNKEINVTNLLGKIKNIEEFKDRNCIKVVVDNEMNAMYMSRKPIPDKFDSEFVGKQVCVIPFRRDFLLKYISLKPTSLEINESIDMLRIMENGLKVKMVRTNFSTKAVDTLEDLIIVQSLIKK